MLTFYCVHLTCEFFFFKDLPCVCCLFSDIEAVW